MIPWTCPSCMTVWHEQPLADGVIGCPECGSIRPQPPEPED